MNVNEDWKLYVSIISDDTALHAARRPRVTQAGRHTYTPKSKLAKLSEQKILLQLMQAHAKAQPIEINKSKIFWKLDIIAVNPHYNPDVDNIAKSVMDLITNSQLFWKDDRDCLVLNIQKIHLKNKKVTGFEIKLYFCA